MADDFEGVDETILTPTLAPPVAGALAPSPYNFDFSGDDGLRVTVHNSLTGVVVAVHYRMQDRDGRIVANVATVIPTADRAASVHELSLGAGYLLNMTVFASAGSPKRGQTFVRVQIIRGRAAAAVVLGTVIQGYITATQDRAWPGSPVEGATEGDGFYRTVTGTDPAAGAEISETVPAGARWQLQAVQATLQTSAVDPPSRIPHIVLIHGASAMAYCPHAIATGGSATRYYAWAIGMALGLDISTGLQSWPLPAVVILSGGDRFTTITNGFQAGDNWLAPWFAVREWLEVQ